ncbi:hypothetical protein AVEN_194937-1 [Araneus ventricosus]|uniref:Uncharacterized protein n=1 Tax=Araneus ventricosus TaxID=182803 RepID=A0A4Y2EYG5_ARAVE|nr:hypothetical protein AVEN_194937-1 [Araneus ventricosus]
MFIHLVEKLSSQRKTQNDDTTEREIPGTLPGILLTVSEERNATHAKWNPVSQNYLPLRLPWLFVHRFRVMRLHYFCAAWRSIVTATQEVTKRFME